MHVEELFPNTYIDASRHELPSRVDDAVLSRRYGSADGTRESVMIEINKKRFMDIASFRKNEGFDAIQGVARAVMYALAQRARERLPTH